MADNKETLAAPSTASTHESAASVDRSHVASFEEKTQEVEAREEAPEVTRAADDAVDDPETNEKDGALARTVSTVSTEAEEYPGLVKLVLVTVALCLAVFCMALVRLATLDDPSTQN
jgi:hypothetical protein